MKFTFISRQTTATMSSNCHCVLYNSIARSLVPFRTIDNIDSKLTLNYITHAHRLPTHSNTRCSSSVPARLKSQTHIYALCMPALTLTRIVSRIRRSQSQRPANEILKRFRLCALVSLLHYYIHWTICRCLIWILILQMIMAAYSRKHICPHTHRMQ